MAVNILVVEDNSEMHGFIQSVLGPFGTVTYLTNGEEAEALLCGTKFDLVLSDQELAGQVTGIDIYLTCRRKYPKTAFLLISAFPGNVFQKLLKTGIECPPYVDKPFTSPQLRNSVQKLLQTLASGGAGAGTAPTGEREL